MEDAKKHSICFESQVKKKQIHCASGKETQRQQTKSSTIPTQTEANDWTGAYFNFITHA